MRRFGLGTEQAVKALVVADALDQTVSESGVSIVQAVADFTHKLSKAKFGQQELADDEGSSTDLVPATPTTIVTKNAPDLVAIKPVPSIERVAHTRSSSKAGFVPKKTKATNKNGKFKSKDSHAPSRKRSMDESQSAVGVSSKDTSQETSRARSDSVDIVTAKLGEKAASAKTDEKTVKNAPAATPSARAKRGRGEENDASASTHKRSRQSAA